MIVRTPTERLGVASRWNLGPLERALVILEGAVSVCGVGGGVFLLSHPLTAMPLRYLDGTWFDTWRWPGVALLGFVGIGPALAVMATLLRRRIALAAHVMVGVGLVAWIVIEAAWMVVSAPLQIAFAVIGLTIVVLAIAEARRPKVRVYADDSSRGVAGEGR